MIFGPREKLNIRLPTDPGPNPYDSKTEFKGPRWLWDWGWWVSIAILSVTLVWLSKPLG